MLVENPRPQLPTMIEFAEFFRPDLLERGMTIGTQALFILQGDIFYEPLSPRELKYCYTYSNSKPHLAGRRAGKLAVARASRLPLSFENLSCIEILPAHMLFDDPRLATSQAPYVFTTLDPISRYNWAISLTHEVDTGIAAAVAVGIPPKKSQQMYVGIDCMPCSRLKKALNRHEPVGMQRIFSKKEIEETKNFDEALAECVVGKEAVAKALGTGISPQHGVNWTDIEILHGSERQQRVVLSGGAQERANTLDISELKIKTIGTSVKIAVVLAS